MTKPGLDQPVGNAAINHVPREMIEKEVQGGMHIGRFLRRTSYHDLGARRRTFGGADLQSETWDRRGISILGTSGIVEPMSSQALLDTIKVELNQKRQKVMGLPLFRPVITGWIT